MDDNNSTPGPVISRSQPIDDDTATEDSDDLDASVKPVKSLSPRFSKSRTPSSSDLETRAPNASKGKQKLGIIGGKKPVAPSSEDDDASPAKISSIGQSKKFGKIGGNRASPKVVDQGSRGPSKSMSPFRLRSPEKLPREQGQSQVNQETPEERALRKRQEAKEIESKKAPVMKKRKF